MCDMWLSDIGHSETVGVVFLRPYTVLDFLAHTALHLKMTDIFE